MLKQPNSVQEALMSVNQEIIIKEKEYIDTMYTFKTVETIEIQESMMIISTALEETLMELYKLRLNIFTTCIKPE